MQADVTLYKISTDKGGQATSDGKYAAHAKSFAGLEVCTCAAQGFATPAGEQTLNVPGIGSV